MGVILSAQEKAQTGLKRCPFCFELILLEADTCIYCQQAVKKEPKITPFFPTHEKLKRCSYCSETILFEAKKCKFCKEFLDPSLKKGNLPNLKWSPALAAFFSFIVPGGGQIYRGKIVTGCLWAFLVALGYGTFILPGIILHLACISFASIGNPMKD